MPVQPSAGPRLAFLAVVALAAGAHLTLTSETAQAFMTEAVCNDIADLTTRAQGAFGMAARGLPVRPVTAEQCVQTLQGQQLALN